MVDQALRGKERRSQPGRQNQGGRGKSEENAATGDSWARRYRTHVPAFVKNAISGFRIRSDGSRVRDEPQIEGSSYGNSTRRHQLSPTRDRSHVRHLIESARNGDHGEDVGDAERPSRGNVTAVSMPFMFMGLSLTDSASPR
jgi:hypothetical protein